MVAAGVEPLFGIRLPVCPDAKAKSPEHGVVTLLAASQAGLKVIYETLAVAQAQSYYRPRITFAQAVELPGTVAILTSCPDALLQYRPDAMLVAGGPRGASLLQDEANVLAYGPVVPRRSDLANLEVIESVAGMATIGEGSRPAPLHVMRADELAAEMRRMSVREENHLAWAKAALDIAERCSGVRIPKSRIKPAPEGWDIEAECRAGAQALGITWSDAYEARLKRELEVIRGKGFEGYFHFVSSIVGWARERMLVGPGRGSAGGSLVAYLLGITRVDPLVHGTLFERFIDASRDNLPDIDVDFQDTRRDQIYEELSRRYGRSRVARLGTVTEFGAKLAIADAARAGGVPWDARQALGRQAEGINVPLSVLFTVDDVSARIVSEHPALARAAEIEGAPRHTGIHAAGVLVADHDITECAAVSKPDREGAVGVASIALDNAEKVNLLKFDALGLTTLSVLQEACELAKIDPWSLQALPLDDARAYEVFQKDRVTGVFQFEGATVRGLMREMPVDEFGDLCALTSLARPGPLQGGAAAEYVQRRAGTKDWPEPHPALAPIVSDTYGLIVYEEQMMRVLKEIGGFDDATVNKVRKSVKKKDPEVLRAFGDQFLAAATVVLGSNLADKLWEEICEFGAYAFNKSHAVAYSMLTYQCAYMKAHYPLEFAVAVLRHAGDDEKAKIVLRELLSEGYNFVAFDPELSEIGWTIKDGRIIGGLTGIVGIGAKSASLIVEARAKHGEGWMAHLKAGLKAKLVDPITPWADIDRIGKVYRQYFDNPESMNVNGPVLRIPSIPAKKGDYCFIATIAKIIQCDQNDEGRIAKRNGRRMTGPTKFVNIIWTDDGVELGSTINRFKFEEMGAPLIADDKAVGSDWLVRGEVISEGGRPWIMVSKMKKLLT